MVFLSFGGRSAPCANAGCQRIRIFFSRRACSNYPVCHYRVSTAIASLRPLPSALFCMFLLCVAQPAGRPARPAGRVPVQCLDRVPEQVMYRVSLQPVHRVSLNFRMVLSFRPAVKTHAGHGDKFSTKTTARQRPKILKKHSKPVGHRKHDRARSDRLEQTSL